MSITDELREAVMSVGMSIPAREALLAICDRIDAKHERQCAEAWMRGHDAWAAIDRSDEMAEHGWVKLPVDGEAPSKQLAEWIERRGLVTGPLDANGELWHSGDMSDSNWGVIEGIAFEDGRWLISGHDTSAPWVPADSIRHYHAPTIEDVLREAITRCVGHSPECWDATIAECAQRIREVDE